MLVLYAQFLLVRAPWRSCGGELSVHGSRFWVCLPGNGFILDIELQAAQTTPTLMQKASSSATCAACTPAIVHAWTTRALSAKATLLCIELAAADALRAIQLPLACGRMLSPGSTDLHANRSLRDSDKPAGREHLSLWASSLTAF